MQNSPLVLVNRILSIILTSYALFGFSNTSLAWGPDGHSTIGILAVKQLQPDARHELESVFGPLNAKAMVKACNWPDAVRETEEWDWSAPFHYINIPRGDFVYQQSRDCPQQQCTTQAIKRYAAELADRQAAKQQRWQAFAWLCHLVGDLHQPLHAGYADDRGGNNFDIVFDGEAMNLHGFWDSVLIRQHTRSHRKLVRLLSKPKPGPTGLDWSEEMVNNWTNESHTLTRQSLYPANINITEAYEKQSWELVQQRIRLAASRLALIINSELSNGN